MGGYPGLCISSYYKKEQERFAKTVTNNLPILSVLAVLDIFIQCYLPTFEIKL